MTITTYLGDGSVGARRGFTTRPVVMGRRGVVATGHYLATAAGFRIMEQGGNAVDAAAAACFCLNLLEPQSNGVGGEVPTLVYAAGEGKVHALSGMGWSPQAFTLDWCRQHGLDLIPGDGYLPACVPAVVGTWALALARFGRLSFGEVVQPAIELAENGYPVYQSLHDSLRSNQAKFTEQYPSTGEVYLTSGRAPAVGALHRNPDWAETLRILCRAERAAAGRGRVAGIEAARDAFYKGEIAERILDFIRAPVSDASGRAHAALLSYEDFAAWEAQVEDPLSLTYHGLDVHKCSGWTQGPVFLQQLALLEGFDLAAMGHNSADYLHTLIECAKLAFADREAWYGDPRFDDAPYERLLSKAYADERRALVGGRASRRLRPGGAGAGPTAAAAFDVAADNRRALGLADGAAPAPAAGSAHLGDTTHLDVVDWEGTMVAATPSGGWLGTSPVVRGLGFPLGTRGQMFYLNPARPNALAPRKRPRATLTPSLVTRGGRPHMVFGTPGGDGQDQWTLQFFLNAVHFGMNLQEALDAPTVHSVHFPSSFYPRAAYPGRVVAEGRVDPNVLAELERRGHEVDVTADWANGKPMAVQFGGEGGVIAGAVSAKGTIGHALAW